MFYIASYRSTSNRILGVNLNEAHPHPINEDSISSVSSTTTAANSSLTAYWP